MDTLFLVRIDAVTRPGIMALLVVLPWFLLSPAVWVFTSDTFVVPLNQNVFRFGFELLGNHRIVFPTIFLQPALVLMTFLAPLLLLAWFYLLRSLAPGSKHLKALIAFLFIGIFYSMGAPGVAPYPLQDVFVATLLCLPFATRLRPVTLWVCVAAGFLITAILPQWRFPYFWLLFSLFFGLVLHFLVIDRGFLLRRERRDLPQTIFKGVGLFLLGTSSLLLALQILRPEHLQQSPYWWTGTFLGLFAAFLAWNKPWATKAWLPVATFSQGILLSSQMQLPLLILGIILLVRWIAESKLVQPRLESKWSGLVILVLGLCGIIFHIREWEPQRDFQAGWVRVLKVVRESPSMGFLVMGEGQDFLAQFSPARFISNDRLIFERSETVLFDQMKEAGVSEILVELKYLRKKWDEWIENGQSPETLNKAVLTRLTQYKGRPVETGTVRLPEVLRFVIEPVERTNEEFFIVRIRS